MAEPQQNAPPEAPKVEIPKATPKPQNPALRMMGLPNWRLRLPSRNWLIFLTITGSWAAAVTYDRRQKKAVQKKWCDLVAHISQDTLPVSQMPRKITVFLSAAPGDGIGSSRKFFKEYVKPILVAAAMDYDVIEGRKEGEVRYGTAEQIRRHRRKLGETAVTEEEPDTTSAIEAVREKLHVRPEPGLRGDLVLGRHTWKEYVRGIHEGWLGPLDEPQTVTETTVEPSPINPLTEARTDNPATPAESETQVEAENKAVEEKDENKSEPEKKEEENKKPHPPPAYLSIPEYSSAPLSPHIPSILEPSQPLHQQHILGFLKTPIRIYNYLNQRKLADSVGRDTAAIILGAYRPYTYDESFASTSSAELDNTPVATKAPESDAAVVQTASHYEQQSVLTPDEVYWHKSVRKPKPDVERVWLNEMVLDPRIADRMRKFELDPEEISRAERIGLGQEKTRAVEVQDLTKAQIVLGSTDEA